MPFSANTSYKPRLGMSSCLLGNPVRYDGADKKDAFICDHLALHVDITPYCPEVAIGLGVPRETIALVGHLDHPQALGTHTAGHNVTQRLSDYASSLQAELNALNGYIVKTRSPSCGWQTTPILADRNQHIIGYGHGIFIARLKQLAPMLPVSDEERLRSIEGRHHFLEAVYAHQYCSALNPQTMNTSDLMQLHARYKYSLMARSPKLYKQLGQHVANTQANTIDTNTRYYINELMTCLNQPASIAGHCNVLQHLMGYFKKHINPTDKAELRQTIENYREGKCSLQLPLTLLRQHVASYQDDYLSHQSYLFPYPDALLIL